MFKDPLFLEETPYDILHLDLYTSMKDVHQALPKFMKENREVSKIAVAQDAIKKLKNINERIKFDLMYYSFDIIHKTGKSLLPSEPEILTNTFSVPVEDPFTYVHQLFSTETEVKQEEFSGQAILINDIGAQFPVMAPISLSISF